MSLSAPSVISNILYNTQAPNGYSDDVSGFFGATLLLAGIVAAIITAPLFDRVFTHHLAVTSKFVVPCIAAGWIGLIFAGACSLCFLAIFRIVMVFGLTVKPNNTAALFVLMAILGACAITMLPVALELACELTRNADASSAILWFRFVYSSPFALLCARIS
jgi:FLVCR family MFS transporter 7